MAEDLFITQASVTKIFGKLLGGKAPGLDEICPEQFESLDVEALLMLTHPLLWKVTLNWQVVLVKVCSNYRGITPLPLGKFFPSLPQRRMQWIDEPQIQKKKSNEFGLERLHLSANLGVAPKKVEEVTATTVFPFDPTLEMQLNR